MESLNILVSQIISLASPFYVSTYVNIKHKKETTALQLMSEILIIIK